MSFQVKNSLGNTIQTINLSKDIPISWYSCGPTVYDSAHLGHARTYITFDIIRRILEHYGFSIIYAMNITDIDDKIIKRVKDNDLDYMTFVNVMTHSFFSDMDKLNVMRPTIVTRVTDYIPDIISYIQQIEGNGFAYESNGSVYLDTQKFKKAGYQIHPLKGHQQEDDYTENDFIEEKRHKNDFVLWKKKKEDGEIFFSSPWGDGRPGWHIECSVMTRMIFGDHFNIHSGGIDLNFPHHNNEIIQAQAYANQNNNDFNWVEYFLHSGHLNIDGQKMSKSLKNFISIKDYLTNIGTGQELRMLFLLHRWDKVLDYTTASLEEAKSFDKKFINVLDALQSEVRKEKTKTWIGPDDVKYIMSLMELQNKIDKHLHDNFNTSSVIKDLFNHTSVVFNYLDKEYHPQYIRNFYHYYQKILNMLGLNYANKQQDDGKTDQAIDVAVGLRNDIRNLVLKDKNKMDKDTFNEFMKIMDDFRDQKLNSLGVKIEDKKNSDVRWTFTN